MSLKSNVGERHRMAIAITFEAFRDIVNDLAAKYKPFHEGEAVWDGEPTDDYVPDYNLQIPPWICQPYYRMPPEEHKQLLEVKQKEAEHRIKEKYFDGKGNAISRKQMKKLKRLEHRAKIKIERNEELCIMPDCDNTRGTKCEFSFCRICCRKKCFDENFNCSAHRVFVKTKRHKAQLYEQLKQQQKANNDGEQVMQVE